MKNNLTRDGALPSFDETAAFHGHACPGLALGYRVALAAMRRLCAGRPDDEGLVAVVENNACGVDNGNKPRLSRPRQACVLVLPARGRQGDSHLRRTPGDGRRGNGRSVLQAASHGRRRRTPARGARPPHRRVAVASGFRAAAHRRGGRSAPRKGPDSRVDPLCQLRRAHDGDPRLSPARSPPVHSLRRHGSSKPGLTEVPFASVPVSVSDSRMIAQISFFASVMV